MTSDLDVGSKQDWRRLTCQPGCRAEGRRLASIPRRGRRRTAVTPGLHSGGLRGGTGAPGTSKSPQSPLSTGCVPGGRHGVRGHCSPLRSESRRHVSGSHKDSVGQSELSAVYLELHDPALVWDDVVRDGVHLPAVGVAAHHHSIRGAAEALHRAVLREEPVVAHWRQAEVGIIFKTHLGIRL